MFTKEKSSIPTGLVWYTNMAAISLLWNTNMAAVTSCVNALFQGLKALSSSYLFGRFSQQSPGQFLTWKARYFKTPATITLYLVSRIQPKFYLDTIIKPVNTISRNAWYKLQMKMKSSGSCEIYEQDSIGVEFNWTDHDIIWKQNYHNLGISLIMKKFSGSESYFLCDLRTIMYVGYRLVDPQLLWQCYDEIHDQ